MKRDRRTLAWLYWSLAIASLAAAIIAVLLYAPTDPTEGVVQKLTYFHVTIAINTFAACVAVFVSNIAYIWNRSAVWDELAAAAAQVTVLFCALVLLTGMIWARQAWGQWWTWSPLLTFSLVLWLLYIGYLVLRGCMKPSIRREVACAMYGVVAFLDVPLFYLSAKLLPDRHPSEMHMTAQVAATLLLWFVPTTMVCAGLIFARFRHNLAVRATVARVPG